MDCFFERPEGSPVCLIERLEGDSYSVPTSVLGVA